MGLPTEYDPIFVEHVDSYLEDCKDERDEFHKTRGEKSDTYERRLKVKLPSIEGFCLWVMENKIRKTMQKSTIYKWADENIDFSYAVDKIRLLQKVRLENGGISGTYNSSVTKLLLSSNHGVNEITRLEHSGKDGAPIETVDVTKMTPQEIEEYRKQFLAD